ncbi:aminotransferase class V-fold PLP-dependent enzyme [Kribbella sandramycini]|uniref:Aminotransferase class V-fold PLP-dependent enzyme n=1 Tax=Kribbella sandramycini TaxID=60450 RepID=A0A7Y4L2B9_9ACTN|nr:aminotransferase class V-fold PLP-dependent enzyme [Kribbella sandramycini]MBB6566278.1 selenocysteine lyase/cysteine desulfurase [Kribbella sandramycini]NOL43059.1 aminotransferase class V-fold PLP-dependent enzyme [Kribbella sandramycini]
MEQFADLWDPVPGWLNTASYGLPPRPAWEALQSVLADWRVGATSWEPWDESTSRSRAAFARLIGADVADVFVGSTVSGAVAPIAAALPDGARVLTDDVEFTSNVFPWKTHEDRGVEVIGVPTAELLDAIRPGVDVVAVSVVQSSTGTVLDVAKVVAASKEIGALVVLDASQAMGWLPLTVDGVDALIVHTYKWLMSPRGATLGYLSPRLQERCRPAAAGWYSGVGGGRSYYGTEMELYADARRFDQSPSWFCFVGAAPALELVEQIGVETINRHNVALANEFREGLGLPPSDSAIVSTTLAGAEEAFAAAGIRAAVRDGKLRASFHLYTTRADVHQALAALKPLT